MFVCPVMRDESLAAERQAVIEAADGFPLARAWAWERDAGVGSYYSEEECIPTAGTSEGRVLILAEDITDITRAPGTVGFVGLHLATARRADGLQHPAEKDDAGLIAYDSAPIRDLEDP